MLVLPATRRTLRTHHGKHERVVLGPGCEQLSRHRRAAGACRQPPPAWQAAAQRAVAVGTSMWRCCARDGGAEEGQKQPTSPGHFGAAAGWLPSLPAVDQRLS